MVFKPVEWSLQANIYEVNTRQYTPEGTFNAFATHLPRLKAMGVRILWFMPITPIAVEKRLGTLGSYYACSDYTSINPEYGTVADFKALVEQAHDLGMQVIIDWVANHTGYGHTWAVQHPEYYVHDEQGHFVEKNGWEDVIDLNYANADMRSAMIDAMRFWIRECDIDGFRCDMAHLVPLDFWQRARVELDKEKQLFWLAECEEPHYHQVFDVTYTWRMIHSMEAVWKEQHLQPFLDTLRFYEHHFPAGAIRLYFTSNHDENSHSGSEFERLGDAAWAFAVFSCTWHGLPLIYSGQEAANKQRIKFFDKDQIDWSKGFPMEGFYKTLLDLRIRNKALQVGDDDTYPVMMKTDAQDKTCCFLRKHGDHEVLVLLNLSKEYHWMHLQDDRVEGKFLDVFAGTENDISVNRYFEMHPWGYYVYEKK